MGRVDEGGRGINREQNDTNEIKTIFLGRRTSDVRESKSKNIRLQRYGRLTLHCHDGIKLERNVSSTFYSVSVCFVPQRVFFLIFPKYIDT